MEYCIHVIQSPTAQGKGKLTLGILHSVIGTILSLCMSGGRHLASTIKNKF
jgi:hypothetical protein